MAFGLGFLFLVLGQRLATWMSTAGEVAFAVALLAWVGGIADAWVVAIWPRAGRAARWYGWGSVTDSANQESGWPRVPEASAALGWSEAAIRRSLRAGVAAAAVLLLSSIAVAASP